MKTIYSTGSMPSSLSQLDFLLNIMNSLPASVYVNELQVSGDPYSCRSVWSNKTCLDSVGYTQEEITAMGFDFFREILHPDDLQILPTSVERTYADHSVTMLFSMQRIKHRSETDYRWYYTHGTVLSCFEDGSPRQMLVVSIEIMKEMSYDIQLMDALKEINRLNRSVKFCTFTKREKEVLKLIAKGRTDKDISTELVISVPTAKKHRTNILHKAAVKNSAELVAMVTENGL